ncbi:14469_t:CDS:1 [Funneliformis mosseae]|uniref:14469_t:CDS:1 n=1 Tax=Funneliformis mosseae TaxID=27381 RepID=A0A9N9GL68_FUNMO|nr:14469_t:CDS:1 [Funneliformis mosseae]
MSKKLTLELLYPEEMLRITDEFIIIIPINFVKMASIYDMRKECNEASKVNPRKFLNHQTKDCFGIYQGKERYYPRYLKYDRSHIKEIKNNTGLYLSKLK